MASTDRGQTVMVRPWYETPAIPTETIQSAFGNTRRNPKVELVEQVIEYWLQDGIPPSLALNAALKALPGNINSSNVYVLIRLLSERGFAHQFFALTRRSVDSHGDLRRLLLSNGVLLDTIRYYDTWSGIDPRLFVDGFVVGFAASFATIVLDLKSLVELCYRANQKLNLAVLELAVGETQTVFDQAAVVSGMGKALLAQLDPTQLPTVIQTYWQDWNAEFAKHLENLEPYEAGYMLGRLGGDLWQLLTGIEAMAKLLVAAPALAAKFAPLLVSSLRTVAAEAKAALASLVELLTRLTRAVVDGVPKMGLLAARTLFPPELMKLIAEGRAALNLNNLRLIQMPQLAYGGAFGGAAMDGRFMMMVADDGGPKLMGSISETLPKAAPTKEGLPGLISIGDPPADFDAVLDDIGRILDDIPSDPTGKAPISAGQVVASAEAFQKAGDTLRTQLHQLLQKTAYDLFKERNVPGKPFDATDFGREIHKRMRDKARALITQASPKLGVYTEQTLRTTARDLAGLNPTVGKMLEKTSAVVEQTIAQMLLSHPDSARLMDMLGVGAAPSARTEKALTKFLSDEFGWTKTTKVGDLQQDLLLVDGAPDGCASMINVDYTSSTKADKFQTLWKKVVEDLGGKFDGDWDNLKQAYNAAFQGKDVPAEVISQLADLQRHALRETLVRRVALGAVFGGAWNIRSYEMLYESIYKMFNRPMI